MINFDDVIAFVLRHEGGYSETPAGEVVNYGININTLREIGFTGTDAELKEMIKTFTPDEAKEIYKKFYWNPLFEQINSKVIAAKLLDMSVLSGKLTAVRILQRVLGVRTDGIFGSRTLQVLNAVDEDSLLNRLIEEWTRYLQSIASKKILGAQSKELFKYWGQVRDGWVARAQDTNV